MNISRQAVVLDHFWFVLVASGSLPCVGVLGAELVDRGALGQLRTPRRTPQTVDRAVPRDRRQPRARLVWHPVTGPAGERLREGLLGALLRQIPVAGAADQRRDDPAPLLAKRGLDGGFGGAALMALMNGLTSIM